MENKEYTTKQEQIARFAKAMGPPARVAILDFLIKQNSCFFGDIHEVLSISKATVSQHLKELKDAGLIQGEIETLLLIFHISSIITFHISTSPIRPAYVLSAVSFAGASRKKTQNDTRKLHGIPICLNLQSILLKKIKIGRCRTRQAAQIVQTLPHREYPMKPHPAGINHLKHISALAVICIEYIPDVQILMQHSRPM